MFELVNQTQEFVYQKFIVPMIPPVCLLVGWLDTFCHNFLKERVVALPYSLSEHSVPENNYPYHLPLFSPSLPPSPLSISEYMLLISAIPVIDFGLSTISLCIIFMYAFPNSIILVIDFDNTMVIDFSNTILAILDSKNMWNVSRYGIDNKKNAYKAQVCL